MVFWTVYFNSFLKSFIAFVVKSFRLFNLHLLLGRSPNLEGSENDFFLRILIIFMEHLYVLCRLGLRDDITFRLRQSAYILSCERSSSRSIRRIRSIILGPNTVYLCILIWYLGFGRIWDLDWMQYKLIYFFTRVLPCISSGRVVYESIFQQCKKHKRNAHIRPNINCLKRRIYF